MSPCPLFTCHTIRVLYIILNTPTGWYTCPMWKGECNCLYSQKEYTTAIGDAEVLDPVIPAKLGVRFFSGK